MTVSLMVLARCGAEFLRLNLSRPVILTHRSSLSLQMNAARFTAVKQFGQPKKCIFGAYRSHSSQNKPFRIASNCNNAKIFVSD